MAFTDNCSIYAALNEHGIDRVSQLAAQEWPSLFNYATAAIISRPDWLCQAITTNPIIQKRHLPLIRMVPPLPVVGTNGTYGLDYCVQLVVAQVDFFPSNVITLPSAMAPLTAGQVAVQIEVRGGIECPPDALLHQLTPVTATLDLNKLGVNTVIHTSGPLSCFQFDVFVVLGVNLNMTPNPAVLDVKLGGLKLVGLIADPLESLIECYAKVVAVLAVTPRLESAIPTSHNFKLMDFIATPDVSLKLELDAKLTATSGAVPNNPAIEGDQVKVFADVIVKKLP